MTDLQRFKAEFSDREGIQFNCAGLAPISNSVALEVARVTTLLQTSAGFADPELIGIVKLARDAVAKLLGASPDQVAFAPNCATALSHVALGYPLTAKDSVVTIDQEYSSNFYPWKVACDRSGAKLIVVQSQRGRVTTDEVIAAVKPGTKLVGVSWVQFQTGSILDLKILGDHCRAVGAHLVVDVIQGLGQLPFQFKDLPVDFVAGGSHKWVCGVLGQGYLAIKPELMQKISLIAVGGATYNRFGTFADPAATMEQTARRFEAGGYNYLPLAGLKVACDLLADVGVQNIQDEITRLTTMLRQGLQSRDIPLSAPIQQPGGLTSFELPVEWEARFILRAREERIAIAKRGPYIRTAIHAFANEHEVDRFLAVLEGCR